ncbi:MAG: monovalent cation:proton antiporter family protein [Anaerolineae bacterium]|jgi:Kef-type K+ transport system membrane component KefB/Trk K+ transport system NAD-binding subunit
MEETHSFFPLLIVVVLAFAVPLILTRFRRLRLPVVVGEILAGILVGDSGLGLVEHNPMLEILALLGFAYLMFLSGLEVDFDAVLPRPGAWRGSWRDRISNPLGLGVLIFALTLALAVGAGLSLHSLDAADDPWIMALILATTSLGVVVPVLKERDLLDKDYGQSLLVAAVIADFVTMLLVSVYVVLNTRGLSPEVLLVLLLFGVFGTAYRMARLARARFPGLDVLNRFSQATAQIDVRGAFAIGLAFIALAQGLGVEMILGAFLGGALISLLADRGASDLHHKLDVFGYAFFIPIFFIMVGVRFDLAAVLGSPQTLLLVPLLLILAYVVKLAAASLFRINHSWRGTLAGGVLLSSHLSLEIAVAAIGLELGVIDQATNSAIILMAIVTCTISPLIFNRIAPAVTAAHRKFVIVGAGRSARLLARRILGHGEEVVLVDQDPKRIAAAKEMDLPLFEADPADPMTWEALEPENIRAVAVLLPEDEENLRVSRLLRGEVCMQRVVSRVHDATQARPFGELGVQFINPSLSPVVELEYLMLFPSVSSLMTDLEDEPHMRIAEIRLRCTDLTDRPLREIELPEGAMIVLIRRNGDVIYPRGHTQLQIGDRLTLMGSLEAVRELAHRCE